MFENVDGRTDDGRTDGRQTDDGRTTDARVTGILIAHLGAFGSGELIKQRAIIQFCVGLGHTPVQTMEMLIC